MVAAVGRELRWPVVATGVLVTGAPIGVAPAGTSEGRDQDVSLRRDVANYHGFLLPEQDWIAQNDEVLGGHPEDFKPEQPGV